MRSGTDPVRGQRSGQLPPVTGILLGVATKLGIFCLEGDWSYDLRQSTSSIRSLVELMRASGQVQAVYRDVGTVEEFEHYCRLWTRQKRYVDYTVGWFAMHGERGSIAIGRRSLSLDELADDLLGRGSCVGKSIYFGARSTVAVDAEDLERFREKVGARVVCGYTEDVDWMEAAAFELLLM